MQNIFRCKKIITSYINKPVSSIIITYVFVFFFVFQLLLICSRLPLRLENISSSQKHCQNNDVEEYCQRLNHIPLIYYVIQKIVRHDFLRRILFLNCRHRNKYQITLFFVCFLIDFSNRFPRNHFCNGLCRSNFHIAFLVFVIIITFIFTIVII